MMVAMPGVTLAAATDASWTFAPGPLILLGAATAAYAARWRRADASAGRLALFLGGIACLFVALVSPVDRLGEQVFLMHMVQHVLLLDLGPILIILGLTKVLLRPVTRRLMAVERRAGWLMHPAVAVALYIVVMWAWHVPAVYGAALEQPALHVLEHLLFSAVGFLYWWHLLSPIRPRIRLAGLSPVVYMGATKVFVGLLGVILTFAPDALYPYYEDRGDVWGLSPQTDQAVAGLVMAMEQSIVMGIALAYLFIRMLRESERDEQRAERYETGTASPPL
jgi:cytochrome c oxidase assembly factor CtaG